MGTIVDTIYADYLFMLLELKLFAMVSQIEWIIGRDDIMITIHEVEMLNAVCVVAASDKLNPIQAHLVKADCLTVLMLLICSNLLVLNHGRACLITQVDFD